MTATPTPTLTLAGASELLLQVAAEHPARVTTDCQYVDHGQVCCLVAHVLHRAGWTVQQIAVADDVSNDDGPLTAGSLSCARPDVFGGIDADAGALLGWAQDAADTGRSWSDAAAAALSLAWEAAQ